MMRAFHLLFVLAVTFIGLCLSEPATAGRKPPLDPVTQALQQAGLKELDKEVVRQLGEAIEVGAPLRLDQRTAYPPTTIENFQPQLLDLTPEVVAQPLGPGDYSIPVIGYCTKWSLHYPGRGLSYKLAPLQGRHAVAIGALLERGTAKGIGPRILKAMAWRIQGGVPLSRWRPQEREWIHQLIPEHEGDLDGDFIEHTRATYEKARPLGKLPPFEKMLATLGPVGAEMLELLRARKLLAHQTLAAERMPDLLYGRPRDGLPKMLEAGPNEPPSPWSEIRPGVFARVTIIKGDIGHNLMDLRITPQARIPSAAGYSGGGLIRPVALQTAQSEGGYWTLEEWFIYLGGLIGYPEGRPAQALILVPYIGIRG